MLTIIIPAYNEEEMLPITAGTVSALMEEKQIPYRILFVDDGSRDGTWGAIEAAAVENSRISGIRFSRNFGKEAAIFAGLQAAAGDCCAIMDCDLQHPPVKLVEMYRLWEQGYEVVEGIKEDRGPESGTHRFASGAFYRMISRAAGLNLENSSDFKLLDRKVVDALNAMPEKHAFFRALSYWVGYKRVSISYRVQPRQAGATKWSTGKLVKYALNNITSFSSAPMQYVTWAGVGFCLFAVILAIQTLVRKLTGHALGGFTTVILIQCLSSGLIMCSMGVIGYYIARIYDEIQGRPRYLITQRCGAKAGTDEEGRTEL